MTEAEHAQHHERKFLPLGSIVILNGSVKKLMIVARGSIVGDDFFDYGAFMYPEGMIDSNTAYFQHDDILKVVHEGYTDDDNALVLEILNDAYTRFRQQQGSGDSILAAAAAAAVAAAVPSSEQIEDLFAGVRDVAGDDD